MKGKTTVSSWGNSLGIRIPKSFADQLDLHSGTDVEIFVENDAILIRRKKYSLDDLLSRVSSKNLPSDIFSKK